MFVAIGQFKQDVYVVGADVAALFQQPGGLGEQVGVHVDVGDVQQHQVGVAVVGRLLHYLAAQLGGFRLALQLQQRLYFQQPDVVVVGQVQRVQYAERLEGMVVAEVYLRAFHLQLVAVRVLLQAHFQRLRAVLGLSFAQVVFYDGFKFVHVEITGGGVPREEVLVPLHGHVPVIVQ